MKISESWLREWVNPELTTTELAEQITMAGLEVDGVEPVAAAFSGVVIARKGAGIAETFTVRRVTFGQGVERVFPVNSPMVDSIEVERRGIVRRAKLYYLRDKVGKSARITEKRDY